MLALNNGKTYIVDFSNKLSGIGPVLKYNLHIAGLSLSSSDDMRDLDAIMDSTGTMSIHVSNLRRSASFALWKIGEFNDLLDQGATDKYVPCFGHFSARLLITRTIYQST